MMENYNLDKSNGFAIPQDTFLRLALFFSGIIVTAIFMLNIFHSNSGIDYVGSATYQNTQTFTPTEVNVTESNEIPEATPVVTASTQKVEPPVTLTSSVTKGTSLVNLLIKQGVNTESIHQVQALPLVHNYLNTIHTGQKFDVNVSADHHLNLLKYYITPEKYLLIKNNKQHLNAELVEGDTTTKIHTANMTIVSSISAAVKKSGLSAKLAHEISQILTTKEIQKGAQLSLLYEGIHKNGKLDHIGNIYGIKLSNGKSNTFVFRNVDPTGEISYYDLEGKSLKPAFLRAPLHYRTISSPFNMHRMHPILRYVRPHTGVDLSAPSGTPVVASSDGRVAFVGSEGGYGRVIKLQHAQQYGTIFAHLSAFAKNLKRGAHVQKGQVIGYVGRSGLADGPHLHYEIRINGKPVNPMTVKLPQAHGIARSQKTQYAMYANQLVRDYLS